MNQNERRLLMKTTDRKGMNRRAFLKNGVAGTAAAMIATPALAESLMQMAKSEPPEFPAPVYRTLGRTGLKNQHRELWRHADPGTGSTQSRF